MNTNEKPSRSRGRGCLIGVLIVLAILGAFGIFIYKFFFGGLPKISRNLSKYEELLSEQRNLRTGFVVFPAKLPDSAKENDTKFYYFYQDTLFDPTAEVYLRCKYSDTDYEAELDRLEHYEHTLKSDMTNDSFAPQSFLRDEEGRFSYPAYIAILADDYAYEYALLTGGNEITYVYFAFRKPGTLRAVPKDCLPDPFVGSLKREEGGYNIYFFPSGDSGDSIFSGYLSYDRNIGQ